MRPELEAGEGFDERASLTPPLSPPLRSRMLTPELRTRVVLTNELDEEEKILEQQERSIRLQNNYKCFCGNKEVDMRLIRFILQVIVLLGIMLLSLIMLARAETCEQGEKWAGLLTLVIGVLLPQPNVM